MEDYFNREEMWALIRKARKQRDITTNTEWVQAYDNFIFACSILDAFMARSSGPSVSVSSDCEGRNYFGTGDMGGPIEQ